MPLWVKRSCSSGFIAAWMVGKIPLGWRLAIARSIALSSSLALTYEWQEGMYCFRLVKESKIKC